MRRLDPLRRALLLAALAGLPVLSVIRLDQPLARAQEGGICSDLLPDTDGDGIPDGFDNCEHFWNPGQEDADRQATPVHLARDAQGMTCAADAFDDPPQGVCVDLDGASEYLANLEGSPIGVGNSATISAWVNVEGSGYRYIFDSGTGLTNNRISLEINPSGGAEFAAYNSSGSWAIAHQAGSVEDGLWHHLVGVKVENAALRIYIDGSLSGSDTTNVTTTSDIGRDVFIGARTDADPQSRFDGRIGHVAIWDDVLSEAEIQAIYAGGHGIDLRQDVGDYVSAPSLQHYWRPGEGPAMGIDVVALSLMGDVCECGDILGDFLFEWGDLAAVRSFLADEVGAPLSADELRRCNVIDALGEVIPDCNILDVAVMRRDLDGLGPGRADVCQVSSDEVDNDLDGWSELDGDCDDRDPLLSPGADEICDWADNDCDGGIDEEDVCLIGPWTAQDVAPLEAGNYWTWSVAEGPPASSHIYTETVLPGTLLVGDVETTVIEKSGGPDHGDRGFLTLDGAGLRLHKETWSDGGAIYSPPWTQIPASFDIGTSFSSSGGGSVTFNTYTYPFTYSYTWDVIGIEQVFGTRWEYDAIRVERTLSLTVTFPTGPETVTGTATRWYVVGIGPVKMSEEVEGDYYRELLVETNLP